MRSQLCHSVFRVLVVSVLAWTPSRALAQNGPYYATPSWDQKLQCDTQATCPRFVVLANFNNEAVLDRETGLVWRRSPIVFSPEFNTWLNSSQTCVQETTGNRAGWRLASVNELASLFDPSATAPPFLPSGHPFTGFLETRFCVFVVI